MRMGIVWAPVCVLLLAGCASQRLVNRAEWIGQQRRTLVETEVLDNLSRAVYNANSIPTRTQLSAVVNMDFTDSTSISASVPLSTSAASLSLTAGNNLDVYKASVSSEIDPNRLRELRNLYRSAVDPSSPALSDFARRHRAQWLWWTNRSGNGPENRPPADYAGRVLLVGSTAYHDFYALPEAFSDFILATLGADAETKAIAKPSVAAAERKVRQAKKRAPAFTAPKGGGDVQPQSQPAPANNSQGPNFLFFSR